MVNVFKIKVLIEIKIYELLNISIIKIVFVFVFEDILRMYGFVKGFFVRVCIRIFIKDKDVFVRIVVIIFGVCNV